MEHNGFALIVIGVSSFALLFSLVNVVLKKQLRKTYSSNPFLFGLMYTGSALLLWLTPGVFGITLPT